MRWSSERSGRRRAAIVALVVMSGWLAIPLGAQDDTEDEEKPGDRPAGNVQVLDVYFPEDLAGNLPSEGGWLAAYVELKTSGTQTETVTLESLVDERGTRVYEAKQEVDVAPGAPRRAWAYFRVKPDGDRAMNQRLRLVVRDAGGRALRQDGPWQASASGNPLSLLVIVEKTGIDISPWPGELSQRRGQNDFSEAVSACPARKLPDRLEGYHGINCVVFRNVTDTSLEPAQLEALQAWVALGGHVVLAANGRSGEIFRTLLARALLGDNLVAEPVVEHEFRPSNLYRTDRSFRGVQELELNERTELPREVTYTRIDPLAGLGVRELFSLPKEAAAADVGARRRVFSERALGRGTVGVLTIDDQAHRTGETGAFLQALWQWIATEYAGSRHRFAASGARTVSNGLTSALKEKRDVGIGFLVGLISGYLILVGPVLYFVLRKLRRLPSVIWAEPLLVVLYLGIIFATAYITKGVLTTTRQYTFLSQKQGVPLAFRESFLTIFAAAETTFRIGAPAGSLVLPLYENDREEQVFRVARARDGQPTMHDLRLAQWQGGYAASLAAVDLGGDGVDIDDLQVTNRLPFPIREGLLRYQGQWRAVPGVQPGQTVRAAGPLVEDKAFQEKWDIKWALPGAGFTGWGKDEVVFAAVVDRPESDWAIDVRTTLKDRKDLYFLLHE